MTPRPQVVIDTSSLICFTEIKSDVDVFACLRLIFSQVLIPTKVRAEYELGMNKEPERVWLLEKLQPNKGFYAMCTRYDSIVLAMLEHKKDIDAGEAEAVAQYKETGAYYILTDDARFTKAVNKVHPEIRVINSLHIVALIDLIGVLPDCRRLKISMHGKLRYKSKQLREAYQYIAKELGLPLSQKDISKRTSLKKILTA